MPHLPTVLQIDRSIKYACKVILESSSAQPFMFIGRGDYYFMIHRLSKTTPTLGNPMTGVAEGFFCGRFCRVNSYQTSDFVTREQFNDSMIMCQCHKQSFAELDYYQSFELVSLESLMEFLSLKEDPIHSHKKFEKDLIGLRDWVIIENCGNFRSLTCENDSYFFCFEMTTS